MFEPVTPESKLYPTDSKEMVGKEEWVAEKAIEISQNPRMMMSVLEWDGENTGSEDLYQYIAEWFWAVINGTCGQEMDRRETIEGLLKELAERYAEYVLLPAHIEKMKKGDFDGD